MTFDSVLTTNCVTENDFCRETDEIIQSSHFIGLTTEIVLSLTQCENTITVESAFGSILGLAKSITV